MVMIIELKDGRIRRDRRYYAEPFEAPKWRAPLVERMERQGSSISPVLCLLPGDELFAGGRVDLVEVVQVDGIRAIPAIVHHVALPVGDVDGVVRLPL